MFTADHDLQMWLREHQPKSVTELINLAEAYQLAHKESDKRYMYQRKPYQYKPFKPLTDEKLHETGKSGEASQKQEKT